MLSPYRVLDCTDDRGQLAGLMLAQLGAEVVLVEPPGGNAARHRSPYVGDRPDPEGALWHLAYNRGKQSVTVDLAGAAGRAELAELAAGFDVLLWSGRPDELPFDPNALLARHPGLVVVVMTPFGLDGPKAGWLDTDLVIGASACQSALCGNPDLPPLRWGAPQAYQHGASDMAVAALVGLAERRRSGAGQLAEISAQVSCLQASFCYFLNAAWQAPAMHRAGDGLDYGAYRTRWVYPATDGEVSITLVFGAAMEEFNRNLFHWIWEAGGCDEATRDLPWTALATQLFTGEVPASEVDRLGEIIAAFTARFSKAELLAESRRRRVLLAPVATPSEVMDNDHLAARHFWDVIDDPAAGGAHRYPGRFLVASATPLRALDRAPHLGEHDDTLRAPHGQPEVPARPAAPAAPALAGLKVLDLSWSVAGPYVGRLLADFGADVIKVETRKRPDLARTAPTFHPRNEQFPLEGSGLFHNGNAGKRSLELDLSTPAGKDVLWDLVRWCDVVVESFSAGALDRMGFGYQRLIEVNPSVILLSSCLPGQTGTLDLPGYGNLTTAMFGFTTVTRWPGRPAAGPFGAYTDVVSPRFGLAGLLAALDHRHRTGEGQHLDLSQAEGSLHYITPALLDAELNGRDFEARGNRDPDIAPHGVYPAAGDDRWVAVACTDDAQWQVLAGLIGRADLAGCDVAERLARQDELDALIAAWTAPQDPGELETALQAAGVTAHQVQNTVEVLADAQLRHLGHFVTVDHALLGPILLEGPRFRLSRTPGHTVLPGPIYGQHTDEVLLGTLGYGAGRVEELRAAGVVA